MCNSCGCKLTPADRRAASADDGQARGASGQESVAVLQGLLDANDEAAARNRRQFDEHGVLVVNLMSSPGAGKTALLETTIVTLGEESRIAVIVGDLDTENDAERIRARGVPAVQLSTGSACHLDARMIHDALHAFDLDTLDLLFIENVGNLVCPASFDLGQHFDVVLLSAPEGDDKPAKYPVMFRAADLMLLTKCDLIDVLGDFDPERAVRALRKLANPAPVLRHSSRSNEGTDDWLDWLRQAAARAGGTVRAAEVSP